MKATLKILSLEDCQKNHIPPFHTPKENQIVLCKQFQDKYRIYKITKCYNRYRCFDIEVLSHNEFHTYNTILSTPIAELHKIFCEYTDGGKLFKMPLSPDDYEYGLSKIEQKVEIDFKFHKDLEDDIMDGIWNYPICKIIKP